MSTQHPLTYRTTNYNPHTARVGPLDPGTIARYDKPNHLSVLGFAPGALPDAPNY